jgi:hypothetical protein
LVNDYLILIEPYLFLCTKTSPENYALARIDELTEVLFSRTLFHKNEEDFAESNYHLNPPVLIDLFNHLQNPLQNELQIAFIESARTKRCC